MRCDFSSAGLSLRFRPRSIPSRNYNKDIYINIKIESMNYHFLTIPFVKYWRHHARNIGKIKFDSISKKIDNIDIIDQLTFL